jgi:hypothetical protein
MNTENWCLRKEVTKYDNMVEQPLFLKAKTWKHLVKQDR